MVEYGKKYKRMFESSIGLMMDITDKIHKDTGICKSEIKRLYCQAIDEDEFNKQIEKRTQDKKK